MRKLPETAPDIYESFLEGKFVVKRTNEKFKAVGTDMCLEQTINRSQKSSSSIIGSSRKKEFVAQWEMIYHEMLNISNLYRSLSGVKTSHYELLVNHEFTGPKTESSEQYIRNIITFIESHENPFTTPTAESKLHNILTQEIMTEEIRKQLLNVLDIGSEKYSNHRRERYVEKTVRIASTTHRTNLKTFTSINIAQKTKDGTKECWILLKQENMT